MDIIIDSLQPAKSHRTSKQLGRAVARGKFSYFVSILERTIANILNSYCLALDATFV